MSFLFERIEEAKNFGAYKEMPKYISSNLTQKFEIREYQENAFRNFITYFENEIFRQKPSQTLFHMATGSGKTIIMAGLILYLYKQGYRNFLFFVNSTNIIEKTKDNFLNKNSIKYLFNEDINIDGEFVHIKEVENFQDCSSKNINICFTTVQGLHTDMTYAKENSMTFDDFAGHKIVLLADEAHHLNAQTKKGNLTTEEKKDNVSWENTITRIFRANIQNIMLEFTATCDLKNKYVLSEYEQKIIYDYPLSKFREDKYSKEVKTLSSSIPLDDRVLQAVLLSQYRLKIFQANKKNIKPIVLLKHSNIAQSKEYLEIFKNLVSNLSEDDFNRISSQTENTALLKMFDYYKKHFSIKALIQEIKDDFSIEKCISVNSKEDKKDYQILINTLEDKNNPIRCIFAVDQLNEGWDVLNLFDIVRLYETRSAERHGGPGKQTIQEAQLIGRGARYCPFKLEEEQERFKRKYDDDLDNDLRICETLYYHCMYNSFYIQELTTAMKETGIMPDDIVEVEYTLKEEFKKDEIFTKGLVFTNERILKDRKEIKELLPSARGEYEVDLSYGATSESLIFDDKREDKAVAKYSHRVTFSEIAEFNYSLVLKALRQFNIYKFNILQKYYPILKSTRQFIMDKGFLGDISILIYNNTHNSVSPLEYYNACKKVLDKISTKISNIEESFEGTKEFNGKELFKVFRDKKVSYTNPKGNEAGIAQSDRQVCEQLRLDLSNEDWFVFNDNYGTSEEKNFVVYFKTHVEDLKNKYDKVYLIRNERHLKIYSFDAGERFEPDYLLFLQRNKEKGYEQYQIFIEPKGTHLIKKDEWKEDFLLQIERQGIPKKTFIDDNKYKIIGFPFYNSSERGNQFKEAMLSVFN